MALSLYPRAYWNPLQQRWAIPVQIAGLGATKSGYGLPGVGGSKTFTLDSDQGLDAYTYATLNLHGVGDYYSNMFSIATDGVDDVMWPSFTTDLIYSSADQTVMYSGETRTDREKRRFYTTMEKWQYSDSFGGDGQAAIYALETYTECYPGKVEDLYYISKYSRGLLDVSENEMHLRVSLPPDPAGMTPQELERYGISRYSYANSGKEEYGYYINDLQYEVS